MVFLNLLIGLIEGHASLFGDVVGARLVQGYEICFLITNYNFEGMQKQKLIDFIVQFTEVCLVDGYGTRIIANSSNQNARPSITVIPYKGKSILTNLGLNKIILIRLFSTWYLNFVYVLSNL